MRRMAVWTRAGYEGRDSWGARQSQRQNRHRPRHSDASRRRMEGEARDQSKDQAKATLRHPSCPMAQRATGHGGEAWRGQRSKWSRGEGQLASTSGLHPGRGWWTSNEWHRWSGNWPSIQRPCLTMWPEMVCLTRFNSVSSTTGSALPGIAYLRHPPRSHPHCNSPPPPPSAHYAC